MPMIVSQYNYTHGEASPLFQGRPDLAFYPKSASYIENMIARPSGSLRTRYGTINRHTFLDGAGYIDTWSFGNGTTKRDYLINVTSSIIQIVDLKDYTYQSISKTFTSFEKMRGAQQQNNYIIVTGENEPYLLTGDEASGSVTGSNLTFSRPPTAEFDNKYAYTTTFTLQTVERTAPGTATSSLPILEITNMGTFGGFSADFIGGIFTSQGDITITDEDGVGYIEEYISSTQVRLRIMTAFRKIPGWTSGVEGSFNGSECNLTQKAFTSTTGYPTAVCFFQDRLMLAGGAKTPQTLFGSQIGDYDNFFLGTGLDDEGIQTTISGQGDIILNMIASRSLQIFTQNGEYSTSLWESEALTPSNARSISLQTAYGSEDVLPVTIDNQTLYVKGGGKSLMSFYFPEGSTAYESKNISYYSEHLLDKPSSIAVLKNSTNYDSNTVFIANNGLSNQAPKVIMIELMSDQNVNAWSRMSMSDYFEILNIAALRERLFFVVRSDAGDFLLEIIDFPLDFIKESPTIDTVNKTVTLGSEYAGYPISVINNYVAGPSANFDIPQLGYYGDFTADINGTIDISTIGHSLTNADEWQYGLKFTQEVRSMPIHVMTQNGDNRYLKKKLSKVYVEYYNSFTFQIGTQYPSTKTPYQANPGYWTYDLKQIPMENLTTIYSEGIDDDNIVVASQSGVYETPINTGYRANTYVTIKQEAPLPLEILGVAIQTNV